MTRSSWAFAICLLVGLFACQEASEERLVVRSRNPPSIPAFPLAISSAGRFLVDQEGDPIHVNGDAAWSLIVQLTRQEVDQYLEDRRRKGFNAVYVNLIEHEYSSQSPPWVSRAAGSPFLSTLPGGELDFTDPSEAYWQHVDFVLRTAAEKGILVIAFPAYVGYRFNDSGWSREIEANGPTRLEAYGDWLGARYSSQQNVIWAMGGDWAPYFEETDITEELDALVEGIKMQGADQLFTAHSHRHRSALDDYDRPWLDVNTTYSDCEGTPGAIRRDYQESSLPFFFIEGRYENERATSLSCIHAQAYWAVLGGAFGHFYGNNPVWPFEAADGFADDPDLEWEEGLSLPGSEDMVHLGDLMRSRPFERLVPDYGHELVIEGYGDIGRATYVGAARATDGSTAIIYIPDEGTITVDLSRMGGEQVRTWWFDPYTGTPSSVGLLPTAGVRRFTSPSADGAVLVFDDASLGWPAPGS